MEVSDATRIVYVIGHKNPDTDSICAALVYAWMKNQTGNGQYQAFRAGSLNRETEFVLQYFNVEPPLLCTDVSPQVQDIAIRCQPGVDPKTTVRTAWNIMRDTEVDTLCVIDENEHILGLVTVKDIANANMDLLDASILSEAKTSYENILSTVEGKLLTGDRTAYVRGQICIATSLQSMEGAIHFGDLVLLSGQQAVQQSAIDSGAACLLVCCNSPVSEEILSYAHQKDCAIMVTHFNTYAAARLISTAVSVSHLMKRENILQFAIDTPLEEVKKAISRVRFHYFPILNEQGKYYGLISRRNLLNLQKRQVILVDHNELTQAVDGIDQANILEVIDHHRIGALETNGPVFFHNVPVGCTGTILYQLMQGQGIIPTKEIAGLLVSAVLSDTLMFRSPTCTPADEATARSLAEIAEIDIETYAEKMFEAGGDLTGRTAEDVFNSDLKIFQVGTYCFGVGQACFMTDRSCASAEELLMPYLPQTLEKHQISAVFFMLTNTPKASTTLLFLGKDALEILQKAFDIPLAKNKVFLPNIVSRKKQLVPLLRSALLQET